VIFKATALISQSSSGKGSSVHVQAAF